VSISQVAETVRAIVDPDLQIEFVAARPGDYVGRDVSPVKARELLGWEATTTFEDGMRRYLDWWLAGGGVEARRASEG
jgi:UDP-glucose 4-epimerase